MSKYENVVLESFEAEAYRMIKKALQDFVYGPLDENWHDNYAEANAAKGIIAYFQISYATAPRRDKVIKIAKAISDMGLEDADFNKALRRMMHGGSKKFLRARREQGQDLIEIAYK